MRLFLIGQKWLGAEVLSALLARGHEIMRVAAPDGDRLRSAAAAWGIPAGDPGRVLPASWVPEGVELIVAAHAHAFITAGARDRTRFGAIGYHPSLLPRHRGRDAVRWAIHMREPITGGTVYWMTDRADAGPVAAQDWCHIRYDDTPAELWRRELGPLGVRLLCEVVDQVAGGQLIRVPQDDALATWEPSFDRRSLSQGG